MNTRKHQSFTAPRKPLAGAVSCAIALAIFPVPPSVRRLTQALRQALSATDIQPVILPLPQTWGRGSGGEGLRPRDGSLYPIECSPTWLPSVAIKRPIWPFSPIDIFSWVTEPPAVV